MERGSQPITGVQRISSERATLRRVAIVAFPNLQPLDVVGPIEVLSAAGQQDAAPAAISSEGYSHEVVGPELTTLRGRSGLRIGVDRTFADRPSALDTLIVAGGPGAFQAVHDHRLLDYVRHAAQNARRICSVCTGALILAEAGLLDGRRATTHWAYAPVLAARFPRIEVDSDAIYCRDGPVWTSAGVSAGMDLALALVEEDFGRERALAVSRQLVMFLKRPGGQSQFSAQLAGQLADRDPLRDLQAWIVEHPEEDLSVESLAARVAMSPRHFARVFRSQVGQPPGRFVESVRVEAARRRLEESSASMTKISNDVGFGSDETMRRAFLRQLGVGPAAYRERFSESGRGA